jgi:hypothetical protein
MICMRGAFAKHGLIIKSALHSDLSRTDMLTMQPNFYV